MPLCILSHRIRIYTQGLTFNKVNDFYCFIKDFLNSNCLFSLQVRGGGAQNTCEWSVRLPQSC